VGKSILGLCQGSHNLSSRRTITSFVNLVGVIDRKEKEEVRRLGGNTPSCKTLIPGEAGFILPLAQGRHFSAAVNKKGFVGGFFHLGDTA